MASIRRRDAVWWLAVRLADKQYQRSLRTTDEREARQLKAVAERVVLDLRRGRLAMPAGVDPVDFLLSDGRLVAPSVATPPPLTLGGLWDAYLAAPAGAKEANTRYTEGIHRKRLEAGLGAGTAVAALTPAALAGYIAARSADVGGGTIRKELATLRLLLNRCRRLTGTVPPDVADLFRDLPFPKGAETGGFLTRAEVAARLRPDTPPDEAAALWERVFLPADEVAAFIAYCEAKPGRPGFLVPMVTAAAHTGARRAELVRSRVEDWDLAAGVVVLREKKRTRLADTLRRVAVSPKLAATMAGWLHGGRHPGGGLAFCRRRDVPLAGCGPAKAWEALVRGSEWAGLRGYHVLRHSFASNLAIAGVDQRVIDELMGHQTEAMRRRYRHFRPQDRAAAVARVFPG